MLKKDRRRNRREEGMEEDRKWGEKKGRKELKKEGTPFLPNGQKLKRVLHKKEYPNGQYKKCSTNWSLGTHKLKPQ